MRQSQSRALFPARIINELNRFLARASPVSPVFGTIAGSRNGRADVLFLHGEVAPWPPPTGSYGPIHVAPPSPGLPSAVDRAPAPPKEFSRNETGPRGASAATAGPRADYPCRCFQCRAAESRFAGARRNERLSRGRTAAAQVNPDELNPQGSAFDNALSAARSAAQAVSGGQDRLFRLGRWISLSGAFPG